MVDVRPKGLTGKASELALGLHNITCNKNGIPFDPEKPMVTSGIRLGTPAATTRGFGAREFELVGNMIGAVLDNARVASDRVTPVLPEVIQQVKGLTSKFPIYRAD